MSHENPTGEILISWIAECTTCSSYGTVVYHFQDQYERAVWAQKHREQYPTHRVLEYMKKHVRPQYPDEPYNDELESS